MTNQGWTLSHQKVRPLSIKGEQRTPLPSSAIVLLLAAARAESHAAATRVGAYAATRGCRENEPMKMRRERRRVVVVGDGWT